MNHHRRPSEFERLVRAHHAAVFRAAWRAVGDRAAAEDAAQDVFLAVLEARFVPPPGEGEGRALRWYAARRALELARAARRRTAREEDRAMHDPQESAAAPASDERGALARHLDALPDEARAALRLRFEEEMTYEALGAALGISASSAHARVERALGRLRGALAGAGFAALAVDVEARLLDLPAEAVPAELGSRLQALSAPAVAGASTLVLVGVGGALVAATAALAAWLAPRAGSAAIEVAALAAPEPARAPAPIAPVASDARREPSRAGSADLGLVATAQAAATAWIAGRLTHPDGTPIEGASIAAVEAGRKGGALPWDPATLTAPDGSFRVEVAATQAPYQIAAQVAGQATVWSDALFLRGRPGLDGVELVARALPISGPFVDTWVYPVRVVDPSGAPVLGARVHAVVAVPIDGSAIPLLRTVPAAAPLRGRPDVEFRRAPLVRDARTDAAGRARLELRRSEAWSIAVDARALGWSPAVEPADLGRGQAEHVIVLERGAEITGRLLRASGEALSALGPHSALAVDGPALLDEVPAEIGPDGSFRCGALPPGRLTLRLRSLEWSPFELEVESGARDLALVLKRLDDDRDVGLHGAELHGRLVDAASGAPVAADPECVRIETLWDLPAGGSLDTAEFWRDRAPWLLLDSPVQRMAIGEPPPPSERFHASGDAGRVHVPIARVPGFAVCIAEPVLLGAGELRAGITLALRAPETIAGRVRAAGGSSAAGAWVVPVGEGAWSSARLADVDRELVRTARCWRAVPGSQDGSFALTAVPPGFRCRLAVLHVEREPWVSGWVTAGDRTVDLELGAPRRALR